jgi:hypothetical protein
LQTVREIQDTQGKAKQQSGQIGGAVRVHDESFTRETARIGRRCQDCIRTIQDEKLLFRL